MVIWLSVLNRGSTLNDPTEVCKGTRQGGLSSPFLFNPFYQGFIKELAQYTGGINIYNESFNVFGYADDFVLASLPYSGLQHLINVANKYITEHGLRVNPSKYECTIFGNCI